MISSAKQTDYCQDLESSTLRSHEYCSSDDFCWHQHSPLYLVSLLIPSAGWIMKAWETSEEDILAYAGLDALVFIRIFVFSIRIFGISALLCIFVLLPINYTSAKFQPGDFSRIASESLDIFTILHIPGGSKRLWAHVFALYVITGAACFLLYFEYKHIAERRLAVFNNSLPRPNHFTILVRGIPISDKNSLSDTVERFFTQYYPLTYHSHQMIYRTGRVQALMDDAEKIYKKIVHFKSQNNFQRQAHPVGCLGLCGRKMDPLDLYTKKLELVERNARHGNSDHFQEAKELPAAFVSFKSRISATVAAQVRQSSNPMLWMTELAPEPEDVYWSNLSIPCRQLWFRKIVVLLGSIALSFVFFIPVAFVQGLSQLDQLQRYFPFLHKVLRTKFASQFITGYLPSVIQQLFMYTIPPIMMFFSAIQGCVSYSGKKKSACAKMIYFSVWNLFFVNVLSGSVIGQINTIISNPKELPNRLAKQVPIQATFFTTYILTSGYASLSSELLQLFSLISNVCTLCTSKSTRVAQSVPSFPYHQEIPKVLLFGLLGFTCSVLAPLILPILLLYFSLGFIIYRNQVLNVYCYKYDTGGQYWPVVHNGTIFSLILTQVIALGVFGVKKFPLASGLMVPLIVFSLLFNEYCRQRFYHIFENYSAEILIDKDREDDQSGQLDNFLETLDSKYLHPTLQPVELSDSENNKEDLLIHKKRPILPLGKRHGVFCPHIEVGIPLRGSWTFMRFYNKMDKC
ncbi:hypothetical protein SUGI_0535560 [Cryptomeria japonica]|nr:hypothetical protein SUGI_0535560 [Cryptomeria japonica]